MGSETIYQRVVEAAADYIQYHRADAACELLFYGRMDLPEAIDRAAQACTSHGDKHPHQWRIPRDVLAEYARRLGEEEPRLQGATSFDEIHRITSEVGSAIRGIGELAAYDTALRIGANLNLYPSRVYLHAGTRDGAFMLGVGHARACIDVSELPDGFARLEPHEIEDCLCIFKHFLKHGQPKESTGCRCSGGGCASPRRKPGTGCR